MKNLSSNSMPKTLSESVYNNLRTGIINNELKAGQRIYEKEIAKLYGVSTTPVREAFLKLNAEGYISRFGLHSPTRSWSAPFTLSMDSSFAITTLCIWSFKTRK